MVRVMAAAGRESVAAEDVGALSREEGRDCAAVAPAGTKTADSS